MQRPTVFVSNTNEKIPFDETFLKLSNSVSEILRNDPEQEMPVEIPFDYSTNTIKRCVEFCKMYDENPFVIEVKPIQTTNINDLLPEWCVKIVDIDSEEIFDLMAMAHSVDIVELVNATCAKIAVLIKGKTPEHIRSVFENTSENTSENTD